MNQHTDARVRQINISAERRLEIIETHIRQAIRHNDMLCSMFGLKETELTASLKRSRTQAREYLYVLEEKKEHLMEQQVTLE